MTEPDVTLTDYALAVECVAFAWLIARRHGAGRGPSPWVVAFFTSTAAAAAFGGTLHGFFVSAPSVTGRTVWRLSLVSIGVTTLAGWAIAAHLAYGPAVVRWVVRAASVQLLVYTWVIFFRTDAFSVAIANYLPAVLCLLAAFVVVAGRERTARAWFGVGGLGLSLAAAAIQYLRIAVHPVYFNHNALYHLVQGIALALLFVAFRDLLARPRGQVA